MRPLSDATRQLFAPLAIPDDDFCRLTVSNELDKFTADFWSVGPRYGANYKMQPSRATQMLIKRFAERKQVTTGFSPCAWEIGATDYSVELIATLFPNAQLSFTDDDTRVVYDAVLARSQFADLAAEVTAKFKAHGEVPEHYYEFSAEKELTGYQQTALFNVCQSPGYGLLMEQGTGKTPILIAAICNAARYLQERIAAGEETKRMYRALIVCPNNVRANWENEFLNFATQPGKVTVLRGPEVGRVKQLIDAFTPADGEIYTIVVCGYETLSRSWEALGMADWDLAALDEGHFIKSVKTKRFQTAMKLRDKATQRVVLTGTPITNTALDLYAAFEFMGKGYSGFSSFEAFKRFYGVFETQESGYSALIGIQNLPFMQERLARYAFLIRKEEALPDLPDKTYDLHEVEMSPQQEEFYNEIAAKLAIEIDAALSDDSQPRAMLINNVLTKLLRLAQITSGFVSWSPIHDDEGEILAKKRIEYFAPNPKIEGLRELLQGKSPDDKTIIWACFVPDIEYIQCALQTDGIDFVSFYGATSEDDRKSAEHRFNYDPACKVFLGNAAAGGTGLNLLGYPPGLTEQERIASHAEYSGDGDYTTNCNHIIYYSQNWSQTARSQSEDRAHRRGTRQPVRITDLVVPQTIDEKIRARVIGKKMHAMDVSDLRKILNDVLRRI